MSRSRHRCCAAGGREGGSDADPDLLVTWPSRSTMEALRSVEARLRRRSSGDDLLTGGGARAAGCCSWGAFCPDAVVDASGKLIIYTLQVKHAFRLTPVAVERGGLTRLYMSVRLRV